jgi:hypothetical protein
LQIILFWYDGQKSIPKLLIGINGELIDAHLVGLGGVGVVVVYFEKVLLED